MYRIKPQALATTHRTRHPTLLVASTVAAVAAAGLTARTTHCQHDASLQSQAEDLKEHVQEFTDQVLDMADSPYSRHNNNIGSLTSERYHSHDPHYRYHGPYAEEPLIPALFYITIAGMAGSVIARKSNLVFRFLSPVTLSLGAAAYCIPKTTNNVLHGIRTYNYGEMKREWQHKITHAKQSLVDTAQSLTATAGSVAHDAKDAVHDLSDKSHELADKTQQALQDAKDKTVEVASDLKDKTVVVAKDLKGKGEDMAKDMKNKSKDLGQELEKAKEQAKDEVKDKTQQAKQWWSQADPKKDLERSAKEMERSARDAGEQAREWVQNAGEETRDWFNDKTHALRSQSEQHGFDKNDVERNFEKLKSKAQKGWDNARDEAQEAASWARRRADSYRPNGRLPDDLQSRGRDMRRGAEQMKDQAQDWAQDRSRELRDRFEEMRDRGQDWTRDRRREFQRRGREFEDQADRTGRDWMRRAQDLRDAGEDRFKDAKREVRHRADDMQEDGRRRFRKLERDVDDIGSRRGGFGIAAWGSGRPSEDDGGRRGRFEEREEYAGRGGRRRSVTEAAKEGKSWWSQREGRYSEPEEKAPWWKAGSTSKDQAMEQFGQAKDHAARGMDHLKDSFKETAQSGRSWASDKTDELKDQYEHGKHYAEREVHDKFSRDRPYHHEQGRDFGGRYPHHHGASFDSNDNWFHLSHGEDNRASAGRGRERGM